MKYIEALTSILKDVDVLEHNCRQSQVWATFVS